MTQSVVDVLLPVFNGAAYLRASIESVLSQTFRDFEFLIVNDGAPNHGWIGASIVTATQPGFGNETVTVA